MRSLTPHILILLTCLCGVRAQTADRELRAQLLDAAGQPVKDATIRVRAVSRASGTRYGETDDVESLTKTDDKGAFVVHAKSPFLAATVTAEAPGYAKGVFTELTTGGTVHPLSLLEGVSVIGTVLKDSEPVAGVKVGISDTDRFSKIFTVDLSGTTDAKGRFRIANVPPKRDYYLFGYMHSFADKGALPSRRITALADGSVLDLGEL
ncbi:MAG TPA: carboxypeptidase-like regulatory domain-containing protein, partial [Verrucomicrobiae bacterium]|nr:carboxypeptidase-like regulatory domain-containing protein [Verrucomicrobiae bacterium]